MEPLTPDELRASFVNCSRGEAKRLPLPRELDNARWADLDFLGWSDPGAPQAAYLVTAWRGESTGLVLRTATDRRASRRQNMCSICLTTHSSSDVALMVAKRTGASGRQGNTVGSYLCRDLACNEYARGTRKPARVQPHETLTPEARVDRLRVNLDNFVRRVLTG